MAAAKGSAFFMVLSSRAIANFLAFIVSTRESRNDCPAGELQGTGLLLTWGGGGEKLGEEEEEELEVKVGLCRKKGISGGGGVWE